MSRKEDRRSSQKPNKLILSRTLKLMLVCGIVAFSVLVGQLYKIMIIDHESLENEAVAQQTRETTVSASRGTIYDTNGNILAISATAYTVFISPYEIDKYEEDAAFIARELSAILGVDEETILKKTTKLNSWYETVAVKIESDLADRVREFKSENDLKGVHIETDSKRYYPNGSLACHVIGFVGTDGYGLEGIEAKYNEYLEGTDGSISRLSTAQGSELLYTNFETYTDAVDGSDVTLTIDVTLQNIAEKYLHQAVADYNVLGGGCCIIMDVNTAEILALACANDYDLNAPWTVSEDVQAELALITDSTERSAALGEAQLAQWRNVAISDTYEPGSVFKPITMAMALEEGVVSESSTFGCSGAMYNIPGRTIPLKCWKTAGHGSQTLKQAAQHSCNVAFVNIGMKVGAETFYDYVEAFGFWDKTGIDLPGEAATRGLWWSEEIFCDETNLSQLAAASFGQTFNATPLQMISAISAIANGGKLMQPYLVSKIVNPDGEVVYSMEPTVVRNVLSEKTSDTVCSILESVVGEKEGTGKNAYVAGYRIAGKTGTSTDTVKQAETSEKEYKVSFCGFAPADDPEIAVLLILDNPDPGDGVYVSGGVIAAPSVGSIVSESLAYLGVSPQYTEDELKTLDKVMPRVTGKNLDEATDAIKALGLSVRVMGDGETVTAQLPEVNSSVAAGSEVILYTGDATPKETAKMPDIQGMSVKAAREALAKAGLFMKTSGTSSGNANAVVSNTSVKAGDEIAYGSVIRVTFVDKNNQGRY